MKEVSSKRGAAISERKKSRSTKLELTQGKTIGEIFTFSSNQVKVECNFMQIRELYL